MTTLIIAVEGKTEETFVNGLLKPHLEQFGVYASATQVGKVTAQRRRRNQRGGGHYKHWRRDIRGFLENQMEELRVSTLIDLYGLPRDFPNATHIRQLANGTSQRMACEQALAGDINDPRFIPYIQKYEFESLLLAALPALTGLVDDEAHLRGIKNLEKEIGKTPPEDINDGVNTAPSKRLEAHISGYESDKVLYGELATLDAGLPDLRRSCPGFDGWVQALEAL